MGANNLESIITQSLAAEKSLRWLAIQFPEPDTISTEMDKMMFCIHAYCLAGADSINLLIDQVSKLNKGE